MDAHDRGFGNELHYIMLVAVFRRRILPKYIVKMEEGRHIRPSAHNFVYKHPSFPLLANILMWSTNFEKRA
jgi:hypothetical protein